jgi:hypothetical protein
MDGLCDDLRKRSRKQMIAKKERGKKPAADKKEQGTKPCSKNCVDPISPNVWI